MPFKSKSQVKEQKRKHREKVVIGIVMHGPKKPAT
jgi:hypothetical protein